RMFSHRIHGIHRIDWQRVSSHRIHRIHRIDWQRMFSHRIHGIHRIDWQRVSSHRFHIFTQMVRVWNSVNSVCSVGPPTPPSGSVKIRAICGRIVLVAWGLPSYRIDR
uniref:hypothetical protein n=1 Tax=Leyella stercorea TaxID=363265 RepID=UPI004025F0BB